MTELEKRPAEELTYEMDFSELLNTGETIDSIESTSSSLKTCEGDSGTLVVSDEAVESSGTSITFKVVGGVDNDMYIVTALVVTNAGNKRQGEGIVSVREK